MKLLATSASYACPMHPDVVSIEQSRCPRCGMKLVAVSTTYTCPMHPEVASATPGSCPRCGMKLLPARLTGNTPEPEHAHNVGGHDHELSLDEPSHGQDEPGHGQDAHSHGQDAHSHGQDAHSHGRAGVGGSYSGDSEGQEQQQPGGVEWEDDMVDVNRITTPANMRWKLVDRTTGAENHEIDWRFRVGEQVKIRLVNEMDSDHPMHHPFHIHGAGRFLVMSRDEMVEPNLVWKDTVLVRTGETVDILLDVTNPGVWMAHCHIAEHHESGMMFSFNVTA